MAAVVLSGCDMGSIPQRVRKQWNVPVSRSDREIVRDYQQCDGQAQDRGRVLTTVGSALTSVFVLPLAPVGLMLRLVGNQQTKTAMRMCMLEAGYSLKQAAAAEERETPRQSQRTN
jgi:hypothetical protein